MKLLLLGCGKLGQALLQNWLSYDIFTQIVVVQPSLSKEKLFNNISSITFTTSHLDIPKNFQPNVTVIAVKPQNLAAILPYYKSYQSSTIFISLAAGISISFLKQYLGTKAQIARVMPNIALQIEQSLNLAFATHEVLQSAENIITNIFIHTGKLIWLENEKTLDMLTPISSSGPAYFFLLAECLAKITMNLGIEEITAKNIIQQLFLGSAMLAAQGNDLKQLQLSVASKGGTTEAAMKILTAQLPELIDTAYDAAITRLNELQQ